VIVQPDNVGRGQSNTLPYTPNPSGYVSQSMFFMSAYPLQFILFTDETSVTTGNSDPYAEIMVLGRNLAAIQVSTTGGTYAATVLVEGTLDGVNWTTIQSITAAGIVQISGLYQSIRASITAYTSGNISVTAISQRV